MFFKHYKGSYYQGIGCVTEANTDEVMMLYRPLYPCKKQLFVRGYDNFHEQVEYQDIMTARFSQIEELELPSEARIYIVDAQTIASILTTSFEISKHSLI